MASFFEANPQTLPQAVAPPPIPDAPPPPPSLASGPVQGAGAAAKARTGGGISSTILTSGQGDLLPANTGKKTLLGQ